MLQTSHKASHIDSVCPAIRATNAQASEAALYCNKHNTALSCICEHVHCTHRACNATEFQQQQCCVPCCRLELGIKGAAYAVLCCSTTNAVSLTLYQTYRDRYLLKGSPKATWGGYNLAAFKGWGKFFTLALPSAAMMCLEW